MHKFLIEVPHEDQVAACAKAIEIFLNTGSHFLSNAYYGCLDGVHKAWILVDAENHEDARRILPPVYREKASIVKLNKFSMEQIQDFISHHNV